MVAKGKGYVRVSPVVRRAFVLLAARMQAERGDVVTPGDAAEYLIDKYMKDIDDLPQKTYEGDSVKDKPSYLYLSIDTVEALRLYADEIPTHYYVSYETAVDHFLDRYPPDIVDIVNLAKGKKQIRGNEKKQIKISNQAQHILQVMSEQLQNQLSKKVKIGDVMSLLVEKHRPDLMERAREAKHITE